MKDFHSYFFLIILGVVLIATQIAVTNIWDLDIPVWIRLAGADQNDHVSLTLENDEQEQILEGLEYSLEIVLRQYNQECQEKNGYSVRVEKTEKVYYSNYTTE